MHFIFFSFVYIFIVNCCHLVNKLYSNLYSLRYLAFTVRGFCPTEFIAYRGLLSGKASVRVGCGSGIIVHGV